ncbi:YheT family hydrolase [Xylophilus sp. ASV27]|uniref:YheT family hydrolase n=1 Tax=Xylophilus sp. ASV27 TaxID=2795129 RepID=UPI0018EC34FC|nr:alpha/beta fold hydrolase [Xylophilus sp. ASV27]
MKYVAPYWLPGGNLQTIWPALCGRRGPGAPPAYQRERWDTPDGDFIDVDFLRAGGAAGGARPLLVLFHGLEGSSRSHYAEAFAAWAAGRGWDYAVPHFRGCGGSLNLAPRAYHSGDFEEIGWVLERLRAQRGPEAGPLLAVGVSLGGNALLRWTQEAGEDARRTVAAVASVCAPLDLAAGAEAISRGFNRYIYTRMFLSSMKPKALAKLAQHPGLFDEQALRAARDLHAFDDIFTAPLHGFRDARDYWARASAAPHLGRIRVPALVLNARNDPFVPAASLPDAAPVPWVTLWRPAQGGHVGFPQGWPPGHVLAMPRAVGGWLAESMHG